MHVAVGDDLGALADHADDHQVGVARIDALAERSGLVMTSADEECGAKAVGAGAEVALAASRSGMGLGEGAALPGFGDVAGRGRGRHGGGLDRGHRRGDVIGRGHVHRLGGTRGRRGQFHGVRPLAGRFQVGAFGHHADGRQVVPRSAAISAGQSMVSSTRLASTTTGSFSKKLPASAMRLASAALRRSGSALCRTTRIAYRVALLKSRARIQCSSWCGTAAGHGKRARSAGARMSA